MMMMMMMVEKYCMGREDEFKGEGRVSGVALQLIQCSFSLGLHFH